MSEINFSDSFLAFLPMPVAVIKEIENELNHPIVYLNQRFMQHFGWCLEEIPDKNTWWSKAYPDIDYQRVVTRQWELGVELAKEQAEAFVMMEVNIQTKSNGQKRFKVYSERASSIIAGHYVVIFEPQFKSDN